jgi:hypothetical protein
VNDLVQEFINRAVLHACTLSHGCIAWGMFLHRQHFPDVGPLLIAALVGMWLLQFPWCFSFEHCDCSVPAKCTFVEGGHTVH